MFCFIFFIYLIYSILYKIMISWSLILFSSIVLNLKTGVALAVKLLFVFLNVLYFLYNFSSTSAKVFDFKHLIPSLNELSIGWKYIHITSSKLNLGSSFLIFLFNSLISLFFSCSFLLYFSFNILISFSNFLFFSISYLSCFSNSELICSFFWIIFELLIWVLFL